MRFKSGTFTGKSASKTPSAQDGGKKAELRKPVKLAYESFKLAEATEQRELTKKDAYKWLKEHGPDHYELPAFDTWERYVRTGQKYYGTQKNIPRDARPSRSIVRPTDIELRSKKPGEPD